MLEVGAKAPQFTLSDKDGNTVSLSDFLNFLKNFTPYLIKI